MVNEKDFNVDDAEEYDDGTRAVTYDDDESGLLHSDSDDDHVKLSSTRKQRLQSSSKKSKQTKEKASSLRVKNWDVDLMESAEYAGKVVKRKDVDREDDGMESPDEDAMAEWSDAEPFGASDDEDDDNEDEEVSGDESQDEEVASDMHSEDSEDDEDQDTEKLLRGFEKEDSAQLMSSKDSAKLVEKATHVRNQKLIWERCLEIQIYTKRLLNSTKLASETSEQDKDDEKKNQLIEQLYSCIDAVSDLQDNLCNSDELSVERSEGASKKRKRTVDDVWSAITEANVEVLPQYNDILNASTRKTNLAGGNQAKKFKAVNQDILAQVESVLADPLRVKRKAHAPSDPAVTGDGDHTTGEDDDNDDQLDELMYDDSDFYQQLLKEFIESGGGNGQDGLVRRTHRKKKKIVNRKASKGRVVRYNVHPKLENFMFPEPYAKPELDVDELFRSIFGGQGRQA